MTRHWKILVLGLCVVVLAGCCLPHPPAPSAPASGWRLLPEKVPSPLTSGIDILIAYGNSSCLHAAAWIATENEPLLFWDPAGGFGAPPHEIFSRTRDILDTAPSLARYLDFRWELGTEMVELFRFNLPPEQTSRLAGLLWRGSKDPDDPQGHDPSTAGLFCSHAISGFLLQHAPDRFPLEAAYIFPHDFSEVLYQLSPNRVFLLQEGKPVRVRP